MNGLELNAQIPVSVWKKSLSLDAKEFSKALAKGLGHGLLGKFDDLADDGVDALEALGLKNGGPEELVFLLVRRALQTALAELLHDSQSHLPLDGLEQEADAFARRVQEQINEGFSIDRGFFEHPQNLPLLSPIQTALADWLATQTNDPALAKTLAARLPGYFPFALHQEWRKNPGRYLPVKEVLDTPFAKAAETEQAWRSYNAYLQQQVEKGAFGEAFGLKQIFIPLNGYCEEHREDMSPGRESHSQEKRRRIVFGLDAEIDRWLAQANRHDAVRVLSGGPGSGKSSFAKMLAARLAGEGRVKVLFAPLHLIDPRGDFVEAVGRFLRNESIFPASYNPLHPEADENRVLLILDGLDELASQGQAAAQTARDFIAEVQKFVEMRNASELRLRVLFSGREVVVQGAQSEFRKPRQILHVLAYRISEEERRGAEWVDVDDRLTQDLRQDWWRGYGRLTGRGFDGMPKELERDDLAEVNAQPLLNYLLALSYCDGGLDFSRDINLNQIYDGLVKAVYKRGYEDQGRGRLHASVRDMSLEDFFLMLEEVALAAWHGDGRSTTISEIEQHCREADYAKQLEAFRDGAERGITRLLAAFFFRQHGERQRGDPTFVFTHKSFGEYLAARRLVRAMEDIVEERERRESKGGGKGWSEADALERWLKLCGPTAVSGYLHRYWLAEVALRPVEEIENWQRHFVRLFSVMLRDGIPLEKLPFTTSNEVLFHLRNAEEALLAAMNACACVTKKVSEIEHPEPTTFGAWFKRIQGQRKGPENGLAFGCLSWLDLNGVYLYVGDFFHAILARSCLQNSQTSLCNLQFANLSGSNLSGSNLIGANLSRADLREANLRGADLHDADLKGADLHDADLSGADLRGAKYDPGQLQAARSIEGAKLNKPDPESPRTPRP